MTPWSSFAKSIEGESLIITTLDRSDSATGFREKDPFVKVIKDHWGEFLTPFQMNKIFEFIDTYYMVKGDKPDDSWILRGRYI